MTRPIATFGDGSVFMTTDEVSVLDAVTCGGDEHQTVLSIMDGIRSASGSSVGFGPLHEALKGLMGKRLIGEDAGCFAATGLGRDAHRIVLAIRALAGS